MKPVKPGMAKYKMKYITHKCSDIGGLVEECGTLLWLLDMETFIIGPLCGESVTGGFPSQMSSFLYY